MDLGATQDDWWGPLQRAKGDARVLQQASIRILWGRGRLGGVPSDRVNAGYGSFINNRRLQAAHSGRPERPTQPHIIHPRPYGYR
jgi:hypothetical protein